MSIKLVYEKCVEEDGQKVKHLFGSETGIPSADDAQLEYVPDFSVEDHIFFYNKSAEAGVRAMGVNASKRQIPAATDDEMKVTCSGFDVLNGIKEKKKVSIGECPDHIIASLDKEEVDEGEEVTLTIEFEEGFEPVEDTLEATAGDKSIELTEVESFVYTGTFTVDEDVEVTINGEVVGALIPVHYTVNGNDVVIGSEPPVEIENIMFSCDNSGVRIGEVTDFEFVAKEGFTITSASAVADAGAVVDLVFAEDDGKYNGTCTLPAASISKVNIAITVATEAIE